LSSPTPIKAVDPLEINPGSGEVKLKVSSAPTEEFMHGAAHYMRHPKAFSTLYDSRQFDRFEGTYLVFKAMAVETFEKHFLPIALDAINAGNETASQEYERREAEIVVHEKAKKAELGRIEEEKAKAAKVKFE